VLAGGKATRLYPASSIIGKQLLPVYDKPMIYYPITTLMEAGCEEILIITSPENYRAVLKLVSSQAYLGIHITLAKQPEPKGIAQALTIAADRYHIAEGDRILLMLGDNLLHGDGLREPLAQAVAQESGATVFLSRVRDPHAYGVAKFAGGEYRFLTQIVEKPAVAPSSWAVTGLYAYDFECVEMVRQLSPSARGELEITDLNNAYLAQKTLWGSGLCYAKLPASTVWFDMGTPDSLVEAASYVRAVQQRSGCYVGCPEEAAFKQGWIDAEHFTRLQVNPEYAAYLASLPQERVN